MAAADDIDDDDLSPPKEYTLEDIVKELNSSYGDFSSFTKPYKRVNTLQNTHIFYDQKRGDFCSRIAITSDHQSPYGDNCDNTRQFILSRSDARLLVDAAPQGFKNEAKVIASALQQAYDLELKRQMDAVKILVDYMSKGSPDPVPAPARASFQKRKNTIAP